MYSLHFYGRMLADAPRMDAYAAALRQTVKPDSVVMDLGCGPGVLALLACKFGARRVYAIEPENVIGLAREVAAANGFADRIEFFEKFSTDITVDERATIIVSDLRGVLPWFQKHIPAIVDARERLLARGGVLIPKRDVLWAAVVEAPEQYQELVGPWDNNAFELDLSAATRMVTNTWRKTRIGVEALLTEAVCWATLDYREVVRPDVHAEISWRVARAGTAHGVAVWFDTELTDGIGFSNQPGEREKIYGQGLFPLPRPVEVHEGEQIAVKLRADYVQNDYVWSWVTEFTDQKVRFEQSTFFGVPLSAQQLKKSHAR